MGLCKRGTVDGSAGAEQTQHGKVTQLPVYYLRVFLFMTRVAMATEETSCFSHSDNQRKVLGPIS